MKPVQLDVSAEEPLLFKSDATYLITGGYGGLGLVTAKFMVEHGASHLVLLGRSQPKEDAQQTIEDIRQRGAEVLVAQTDISKCEQVVVLLNHINESMPPLRGVMHAAGVLDDGTLLTLDWQRFSTVLTPKVLGAWHLHQLTQTYSLDFFVCFSSVAALLGSPGQGNYSAANAFLDVLMYERRRQGLPALSINWGSWAQVGLAAAQANRGERIALRGLGKFSPDGGLQALGDLLRQERPQVAFMAFDFDLWQQFHPQAKHSALLAYLGTKQAVSSEVRVSADHPSLRQQFQEVSDDERLALLETAVIGSVARTLGYRQTKVDQDMTLQRLGLDSLMVLEVRNTLARELEVSLPLAVFFGKKSLRQVVRYLYEEWVQGASL